MIIIAFILFLPLFVYGFRAAIGETSSSTRTSRIMLIIFLMFMSLYCILFFSGKYNYYLRGYRSTSFAYLATALGGILYCLSDRRPILTSFIRIVLNLVALVFMAGSIFLTIEIFEDYGKQLFYSDNKYRLEATGRGIMAQCGLPTLFVKEGIIERQSLPINSDSVFCISKKDLYDIRVGHEDSCYVVDYYFVRNRDVNNFLPFKVRYSIP